jgi:hypothetical protein
MTVFATIETASYSSDTDTFLLSSASGKKELKFYSNDDWELYLKKNKFTKVRVVCLYEDAFCAFYRHDYARIAFNNLTLEMIPKVQVLFDHLKECPARNDPRHCFDWRQFALNSKKLMEEITDDSIS